MSDILPELNGKEYYKNIEDNYNIHFCSIGEVDKLVDFLKKYWRENHIFVLSRKLLDWQHLDEGNNRYNFVVAKEKFTGEIHSILGFVPTSQYDSNIRNIEIWPCIWRTRPDVNVKGLGTILYYFLKENIEIETISILGISEIALSIYKKWDFISGKINHYYIMNPLINCYKLLGGYDNVVKYCDEYRCENVEIEECEKDEYCNFDDDLKIFKASRYKSKKYYENRFLNHPIYKYKFLKVVKDGSFVGIFVGRECSNDDAKCLRIVDFIGDIKGAEGSVNSILKYISKLGYEYIDFISAGIDDSILKRIGFVNKKSFEKLIIPNYFEPFLLENVDLDYAFKTVENGVVPEFYKADADQDRPNVLI